MKDGKVGSNQGWRESPWIERVVALAAPPLDMANLRSLFWLKHEGVTTEIFHFIIIPDLISYTLGARLLVVEITLVM